jgi:hypothetical protein
MASNAEMLRLIEHASAKLDSSREEIAGRTSAEMISRGRIDAALMAMSYAQAILSRWSRPASCPTTTSR